MPEYKSPSVWRAFKSMLQRGWSYIVKAGTVILVSNFIIYMMQNFNWSFKMTENPDESILATIATPVAYIIAPVIGVVAWRFAAAAVTGFIAKECVVGTLATCFAFEHLIGEDLEMIGGSSGIAASMGICPAACTASQWKGIPFARHSAPISLTGWTVPISLLANMTVTSAVSGRMAASRSSRRTTPSS